MTIFIFLVGLTITRVRQVLFAVVAAAFFVVGTPAMGAGYLISAQDRARATALSQQAYDTFQTGDYMQALVLLTQADLLKPDQPDGWNLRGMIYLRQKAYDQAQAAFSRAVALDPDLWAARFNLAEVAFQRRDYSRARAGFEHLLSQTDRFKEKNKWELVQYKTIVCCLQMGDEQSANKKLARLPDKGAATPAFSYAQAAVAYRAKNLSQAQKFLAAAQAGFPVAVNDLFADSLVQAGWQTAPVPTALLAANVPATPPGAHLDMVIDPRLQADSAGPLPVADAPMRPILSTTAPPLRNVSSTVGDDVSRKARLAPTVAVKTPTTSEPSRGMDLENGGLLLDE